LKIKVENSNFSFKQFCFQCNNFPPDKHRSRYGKYGPRSEYGFLRTACQPIRIENFEKPYNNMLFSLCSGNEWNPVWHKGDQILCLGVNVFNKSSWTQVYVYSYGRSCANKLYQGCRQADIRMCSHCLFPVVVTSLEQVVIILLQGWWR
jgi:hypothetical protein